MSSQYPLINRNVVFVDSSMLIQEAVTMMVDRKIGSVLVKEHEKLVGILTERDIVRKFTLLDLKDKLQRQVNTIMSRPILWVHEATLIDDIKRLYLEKKIRHFPVLYGDDPLVSAVVGIVSISDFFKYNLIHSAKEQLALHQKQQVQQALIPLAVFVKNPTYLPLYQEHLNPKRLKIDKIEDFNAFIREKASENIPLLFDLDGFSDLELKKYIPVLQNYKGLVIMTTSNPNLAIPLKRHAKSKTQSIVLKPVDFEYCSWFIGDRWEKS